MAMLLALTPLLGAVPAASPAAPPAVLAAPPSAALPAGSEPGARHYYPAQIARDGRYIPPHYGPDPKPPVRGSFGARRLQTPYPQPDAASLHGYHLPPPQPPGAKSVDNQTPP